jgi:hypothetical protein
MNCRREGRRRLAGLAGVVLAAGLVAAAPGVADAAGTWTIQPTPLSSGSRLGELSAVSCPTSSFCVATDPDGGAHGAYLYPAVEVWNGTSWAPEVLPIPPDAVNNGNVTGVSCVSATSCLAVGHNSAAHWNGSAWKATKAVAQPPGSTQGVILSGVSCAAAANCTAVGDTVTNGGDGGMPLAEQWDGSSWALQDAQPAPSGTSGYLNGVSCPSASVCFAAGEDFSGPSAGTAQQLVERWAVGAWTVQTASAPSDAASSWLTSISCVKTTRCVAGGLFTTGTSGLDRALAENWNGHAWQGQQAAPPRSELEGISCVAGSSCTAVGYRLPRGGTELPLAEQN